MTGELLLFLKAWWYGVRMMAVYDCFRILRRVFPHSDSIVSLEDILYWTAGGLSVFVYLYRCNRGVLRGYFFAGMALGMFLYFCGISPYVVRGGTLLLNSLRKILGFAGKAVKKPIKRLKYTALRVKLSMSRHICRNAHSRAYKDEKNGKKIKKIRKRESGHQ